MEISQENGSFTVTYNSEEGIAILRALRNRIIQASTGNAPITENNALILTHYLHTMHTTSQPNRFNALAGREIHLEPVVGALLFEGKSILDPETQTLAKQIGQALSTEIEVVKFNQSIPDYLPDRPI